MINQGQVTKRIPQSIPSLTAVGNDAKKNIDLTSVQIAY